MVSKYNVNLAFIVDNAISNCFIFFLRNTSFIELNDISIVTKNGFNYKFIEILNSKIGRKIGIEIFN